MLKGGISALQAIAPTSIFRSKTVSAEGVEGGTYALRGIACKAENRPGAGCQKGIPPLVSGAFATAVILHNRSIWTMLTAETGAFMQEGIGSIHTAAVRAFEQRGAALRGRAGRATGPSGAAARGLISSPDRAFPATARKAVGACGSTFDAGAEGRYYDSA